MRINEHRTKPQGLADLLLADALIEDGIVLQQDGSLLAAWEYTGPDLESAGPAHLNALVTRMAAAMKFGSGWMIHCDVIRSNVTEYPAAVDFPDPVSALIDDERRAQFTTPGVVFRSRYYLTLTYLPPIAREEKAVAWLVDGAAVRLRIADVHVRRFKRRVEQFEDIFGTLVTARRLKAVRTESRWGPVVYDDLLRFLHQTITGFDHPIRRPDYPFALADSVLATEDFVGGLEPRIGQKHIRALAIDGFPKVSTPGILAVLDQLPIEYRWSTRAILMDPYYAASLIEKVRVRWRGLSRGIMAMAFGAKNDSPNEYAIIMLGDAGDAKKAAQSNDVQFCQYTSIIVLLDEDAARIHDSARTIQTTIDNLGFHARIEHVNAIEAWRGTIPGDGYANIRRVQLHTLNLADMLPITSVWCGLDTNPSALMPPGSPPLLYALTTGANAFKLNPHVSDVGHTLMVGPSGTGKSTAVGVMAAQWLRYPGAKVFSFDWDYSVWLLCNAVGGQHYDLMANRNLAFCPLRNIDTPEDRTWATTWLEDLCRLNGLAMTPRYSNALAEAVNLLAQRGHRTLTDLISRVNLEEVKEALKYYTTDGTMGAMLDSDHDSLAVGAGASITAFETKALMQGREAKATLPVLLYLFRRIEQSLYGDPTLIILDEAWAYLAHEVFRNRLDTWLRTMRRRNAVVVLATQQISDIANSPIADTVFAQTVTKILLPNPEATNIDNAAFYARLGLNSTEISMIQRAIPKSEYYVTCANGRRMIDLALGQVALAFTSVNGPTGRAKAEALMRAHPNTWQGHWLVLRGREAGDANLIEWGNNLIQELEGEPLCVLSAQRA
jgi:type IV secretion system protein VirB4